MNPKRRSFNRLISGLRLSCIRVTMGLMAVTATGYASTAAAWPDAPVTVVAPFSPGGGGDTLARLYGNELAKVLGVPVVVDNRPGAGGNIGTASVTRATADGNTLVYGTNGTMGTNHALYSRPGFSVDDFEPISLFGKISLVFTVNKDSPFHTVADVVEYAKNNPRELTCASGGNGTTSHLACAMFQKMAGIEIEHIPYRSGASAVVDMMSDRISFLIDVMPYLAPHIAGGKIRALAVTMNERVPALKDVPTMGESGVPGYELFAWDGLFAPKGVPEERLDRLHGAVMDVISDSDFERVMTERGTILSEMPRQAFAGFVKAEYARMGSLANEFGIRVD